MNKHLLELINLAKENPDLPIIPLVEGEVVADSDSCDTWCGEFSYCYKGEYAEWQDGYIFDDRQYLEELYADYYCDEDLSDKEISDICAKMWHPAIFICISPFSGIGTNNS